MSLRIAPLPAHPSSTTNLTTQSTSSTTAPSAPGLPDTLRSSLTPTPQDANSKTPIAPSSSHPLEARLVAWKTTQHDLKMQGLRRTYGIAEPVRREMELKDVRTGDAIGASFLRQKGMSLGEEILVGRENEIGGWEGVFEGGDFREGDFHSELESRAKMNW
ncbi:MAG: hypothetical protein HETSPECPRED_002005 [Heterodermia speciosa]|uniref:Proteasome maturation factor UMP1 n=1 Tax=Heterodermia speciosa TaxID=116794 RepID=A0A8H3F215_9LECA|nr:MAG: hypothetical protein HETSPECPRED_002005 [Heterodermia speciosa]